MTPPTITAIAPWFGGKRNLAPAIVEELGLFLRHVFARAGVEPAIGRV